MPLAAGELRLLDEVVHDKSIFSDGVSTMSLETSRHLVEQHYLESRSERPANLATFSTIQIRCNGLKGMLSLDPRLEGRVIHYRPSQVKFSSTTDRVEIARTFVRPIIARLCRPHIQLLDHLRVPVKNLLALQDRALTTVRRAFESITRAATFIEHNNLGAPFRLNTTLNDLAQLLGFGLSDVRDPVFRRALHSGLATVVRQIKCACPDTDCRLTLQSTAASRSRAAGRSSA